MPAAFIPRITKLILTGAALAAVFAGAWVALDVATFTFHTNAIVARADLGCGDCGGGGGLPLGAITTTFIPHYQDGGGGGGGGGGGMLPALPSCTISASPLSIQSGSSSTLSWDSMNADSLSIDHGIGTVTPTDSSMTVSPTITTTYTATVTGPGGTAQCATTITVELPPPPPPPPHYGAYCGDGVVNQSWEQCDGDSQCSDKCQIGNQCTNLVLARVNITDVQNSTKKPGNMTSDLFIGGSGAANKIPQGAWFALFYNGSYYTDPDIESYEDVPGLAVERAAGKLQTLIYGSHNGSNESSTFNEHVEGNIETWQANITDQVPDTGDDKLGDPFDGVKKLLAGQDELWLSGGKSYFWMSVAGADDGFWTLYDNTAPSCKPPPPPPPPPPDSFTLKGTKIVCSAESDLPNWGGGGPDITAMTATDYVSAHPDCHFAPNWGFEWATGNQPNPGDNLLSGGSGWTAFGPTDTNGIAATNVSVNSCMNGNVWVRERWKSGYIPFTGVGGSDVSAEMYCSTDVQKYDNYELIKNPAAGHTYYCVAWNVPVTPPPPPPGTPSCTLSADPSSLTGSGQTNLSWTTTNATSASIDTAIGTVTPVAAGSVNAHVSANTTYTMTVTGPGGTANCHASVTVSNTNNLSCTLSLDASNINTGQSVNLSWTSTNATSGFVNNNVGSTSPVSSGSMTVFPPSSTTFIGTFAGPTGTTTCSISLTVHTGGGGGGGGGGCVGSTCPGGFNQPNVSMFRQPGEQPLAFVSLSQIPYTGFEAGPALTMIFWLAVGLLSALIAYFIVGKGGVRSLLAYILGGVTGLPIQEHEERQNWAMYGTHYPVTDSETPYDGESVSAPRPAALAAVPGPVSPRNYVIGSEEQKPAAPPAPVSALAQEPDIHAVLESRAHAAGVLMSPEAVTLAAELSAGRQEALRLFGDLLNEAVKTIPREDGWIMLTADRLQALSAKQKMSQAVPAWYATPPHTVPSGSLDEHAASEFAGAVLSADRENAFSIIRSLEHDGMKPTALMTATATVLDKLYRARRDNRPAPDAALAEKASHVSNEQLAKLVEVFTHSLDHVYTSPFTGVKLALAQAFEAVGG